MSDVLIVELSREPTSSTRIDTSRFVIDEALSTVTEDEIKSRFGFFGDAECSSKADFPLYRVIWTHLTTDFGSDTHEDLVKLSLLAERLRDEIDATEPTAVRCDNLPQRYEAVVSDVTASADIPNNAFPQISTWDRLWTFIIAALGVLPFLFDQFFSMIWWKVPSIPNETDTLFIPAIGRFESMEPVIQAAKFDYTVVISPMTLATCRPSNDFDDVAQYVPITFSGFATFGTLSEQLTLVKFLFEEFVTNRNTERQLRRELADETGIELPATVSYGMATICHRSIFRSILYYPLAVNAIERTGAKDVVVGAASPFGRTVFAAGQACSRNNYHVPHGVSPPLRGSWKVDVTEFLPSTFSYKSIQEQTGAGDPSSYVVTGKPQLESMRNEIREYDENLSESVRLLIATTPLPDEFRCKFVETVVEATSELETETVVKIHPIESVEFYERNFENEDFRITDLNLYYELAAADIVVIGTSSVGIKAILSGAAVVAVNFLHPFRQVHDYVSQSPVPELRESDEVLSFFEKFDDENIEEMKREQAEAIKESCPLSGTAREITTYIDEKR